MEGPCQRIRKDGLERGRTFLGRWPVSKWGLLWKKAVWLGLKHTQLSSSTKVIQWRLGLGKEWVSCRSSSPHLHWCWCVWGYSGTTQWLLHPSLRGGKQKTPWGKPWKNEHIYLPKNRPGHMLKGFLGMIRKIHFILSIKKMIKKNTNTIMIIEG